jgi:transcriptional regulator with XRE-family HTH domain
MTRKADGMSLEEIGEREGLSPSGVRLVLTRAMSKLRREGLLVTCRELAEALDANRSTENVVRPARRR